MVNQKRTMTMRDELNAKELTPEAPDDEGPAAPTPLELSIREVVRKEGRQEDFAEKVGYVYATDGKVQLPRTRRYVETDADRLLLVGTEDYVFKSFIEGPLKALFGAVTQRGGPVWKGAATSRHQGALVDPVVELTALGQQIVLCCRLYEPNWAVAYSHHVFDPATTVMLRAMRRCGRTISALGEPGKARAAGMPLLRAMDWLVRFVRRIAKSWPFINALNAHARQAQDNFESGREYIYHRASGHSKLLILRIDLYYKPYFDVAGADNLVNSFLRWLRSPACKRNLLPSYLGFLVKRENGLVRGMHYHVMVVCNGNEQRSAEYLTRQLGQHWATLTGQGPGSFHNCYADKDRYHFNGLGVLELDDWEKMAGLRAALWYMTKADCVIKASNSKVKNFWRSPIPRKARKKLGRPRADADPLKLLRRMLGGKRSKYPPGIVPAFASHTARVTRHAEKVEPKE